MLILQIITLVLVVVLLLNNLVISIMYKKTIDATLDFYKNLDNKIEED